MIVRIVAGAPSVYFDFTEGYVIAVDKGVKHCLDNDISIDLAIGDFDSFDESLVVGPKIVLDKIKDETDLFVAIQKAIEMKPSQIIVYGGTNGRFDHYHANVNLLGMYNIVLVDDVNRIYVRHTSFSIETSDYVSFFNFSGEPVITLRNFKYPLVDYSLKRHDNLCVSNEVSGLGEVTVVGGSILVVESKIEK